jgi:hypothetical protein
LLLVAFGVVIRARLSVTSLLVLLFSQRTLSCLLS